MFNNIFSEGHEKNSVFITTPIYYVNDKPHIGHAYTSVLADIYSRYFKLLKDDVKFLTGTDEHGQKIQKVAQEKNISPQELCDTVSKHFKDLTVELQLENDDFIRTTEDRHKKGVIHFWNQLHENGWIYKGLYKGWYSVSDESFYAEKDLIDGKAPTGSEVEYRDEESYFFRLSEFQEILLKIFENKEIIIPQNRENEVVEFIKGGLTDLSISRTHVDWGVRVPNDESHIIYVWLDALTNYINSLDYPEGEQYSKYWENGRIVHFIGKDISRFHSVYWFAFLIATKHKRGELDNALAINNLPKISLAIHGWWVNNGKKISKSLGNVIDPSAIISKFGIDKFRFFLVSEMPFGNDGNYSEETFIFKTNANLANNIGNLAQRIMSFICKNCNSKVPEFNPESDKDFWSHAINESEKVVNNVYVLIQKFNFYEAVNSILEYSSIANEFVDYSKPWTLYKEGHTERLNNSLYISLKAIYLITVLISPIVPNASKQILNAFGDKFPETGNDITAPGVIFERASVVVEKGK